MCAALPFNEQADVKVISVQFASEVEGALRYARGAAFCDQSWQVDEQCEGSVLAPGLDPCPELPGSGTPEPVPTESTGEG